MLKFNRRDWMSYLVAADHAEEHDDADAGRRLRTQGLVMKAVLEAVFSAVRIHPRLKKPPQRYSELVTPEVRVAVWDAPNQVTMVVTIRHRPVRYHLVRHIISRPDYLIGRIIKNIFPRLENNSAGTKKR